MNEEKLSCAVLVSCQRALLGVITPHVRMVSIEWEGLKRLSLRVHYDRTPSADEVEEMEIVTTEIISDVPFDFVNPVEVVVSDEPISRLRYLARIVYLRKE